MGINQRYDIIVVGAGPAGTTAAHAAAQSGVSVLLMEKDRETGSPVRCAEAIGEDVAREFFADNFDQRWISATINKFKFVSPDGTEIYPQVKIKGFVLNRKIFDADLAARAAAAGSDVVTRADVTGLFLKGKQISGVRALINGRETEIEAKLVIGADGVESRVGRWAGISSAVTMRDMETCYQVTLGNMNVDQDTCVFYFSQADFPGGYAWLFPKGEQRAHIGLGIAGNQVHGISAEERLGQFLERSFPGKPILAESMGGVPCADRPAKISGHGLLLAGDAACQTNPISGGGIAGAMVGGRMAGLVAAESVKKGDPSQDFLSRYEKLWDNRVGRNQRLYYKIKLAIQKLSDQDLNETARNLHVLPRQQQTLSKIFQTALRKRPSLMLEVAKLFNPFS